ncbi:hypothetical protein EU528_05835 [Candidatus Thorarchaeota archaeon]|nr:MAG: hypothetical protein EU528_05835 [Candidatus Thorarchaeota archaeon]
MSDEGTSKIKFIDKDRRRIELNLGGLSVGFPLNAIPDAVYEAIANAVNKSSSSSETINELYIGPLTKPSVATLNASNIFPINSARKVIRLTLTDETIEDIIDDFEGAELAFQGRPFEDTLDERIDLYQKMMLDDSKIDRFRLGAVEMYGDQTYQNILRDPRITLNMFWTQDNNKVARSFQINCIAEVIPPGTPFYRYMRVMRRLFSSTLIDTDRRSPDYVCAYKFWVCEAKDKSLTPKTGFVPD